MAKVKKTSSGGGFFTVFIPTMLTGILLPMTGPVLAIPVWVAIHAAACHGTRESMDERYPPEDCDRIAQEIRKKTGKKIIKITTSEWTDATIPLPQKRVITYHFKDD